LAVSQRLAASSSIGSFFSDWQLLEPNQKRSCHPERPKGVEGPAAVFVFALAFALAFAFAFAFYKKYLSS
jgi:hypothetical protein